MKYLYKTAFCLLLAVASLAEMQAQDTSQVFKVVKSSTGQSFLLNTKGTGATIFTDMYFRTGPIYEFDSTSGICLILSKVISAHIESELRTDGGKKIKYYSTVEPEQLGFHFESSLSDLDYVTDLINRKIVQAKFDDEGADEAKTEIRADLDSLKKTDSYSKDTKIAKRLWGNDYKKLSQFGDEKTYLGIKAEDLIAFHKRYFLPFNNTLSVLGNFQEKEVLDKLLDVFKGFKSREFNPELINMVVDFKPMIYTIQLVSLGSDRNIASITYQNPGARQDRDATYCAFVLTQLMNDRDGRIQKSMKQAGLKGFKAVYNCNNFYGSMVLSAQVSEGEFFGAFTQMSQLISDISQKDYFKEGEVEKAERNIEIEYRNLKANNMKGFMNLVTRYRFSNDENYFTNFTDSTGIKGVTIDRLRRYTSDYFADHSGVRCLVTSEEALKDTSDQQYFPLDDSISDLKFSYDLNKSDIESAEARQNLKKLIQWLKINPDVHIQINGFADQGEFTKAYSDSVLRFIDSTPTFHRAMPEITKKGYLRIEFMRAMKIAKALYEAGITSDRISGTSMVFSSDTKEAADENRKCTLTLEKVKPQISLYEYHFGKKKEEKAQN